MQTLFEDSVADYDANRPGYPGPLYDFLIAECNMDAHSVIVDVGAGTGKGSDPLLDRGLKITPIDAGEKMLTRAPRHERRMPIVAGAEEMPLRGATVDLIICAQSFHWFATTKTLSEFARVLKPEGRLALFWNTRRSEPHHQKLYEDLIVKYNPAHDCAYRRKDWSDLIERGGTFRMLQRASYEHAQTMSVEAWQGLARSTSYIRCIGDEKLAAFEKELGDIMASQTESIDLQYTTNVWLAGRAEMEKAG